MSTVRGFSATPQEGKDQQILTGEGLQNSRAWRRMSASRGLVFTASGPAWRWTAACFASSVMQRARGQTGAMLQRLHPTLRSRASTCSYSVKGQKSTLLYPAPLSDHHLSRVEGGRLTLSP